MSSLEQDISGLLADFEAPIDALTRQLVAAISAAQPELLAKVQPGWRSINFRHPRAGFMCGLFPFPDRVSLYFEHGRQLSNAAGLLEGRGARVRFIRFVPGDPIPEDEIALLLAESVALRS